MKFAMACLVWARTALLVATAAIASSHHSIEVAAVPAVQEANPFSAHQIFKRQRETGPNEGALYCVKAPCADNSCCGPGGTCGYGPDFCGTGCTSNCNAVAMCGKYADPATNGKCGMNLCCSWGGWCGTADVHCIGPNKFTPCQQNYGSCEIIRPKTCGEGSGTTGGRTVGYYLASNVRDRLCNRISPSQIDKDKYTHLYFAFAYIDPTSFHIMPAVEDDAALMKEFSALKSSKLQTWIAVGGYSFSDNGTTHTTWSDMCSSQATRASFIQSTITFMDDYGFQGIDIDWEYPVSPDRGGKLADTANLVSLVKEMRAAYGTKYGLSLTLAPDYWYLRYFDAKAMEPYVDYFGFMAYDLHGSWDTDVHTLGSIVRGQADVREIANDTLPLAYAGLDHSKINFGLAWYGRGYTLTDPSCNELGCPFSGPSKPGKCTNSAGVMSLTEIKQLIKEKRITPRLNNDSKMKELVWGDQWIGYDDEETHEMKRSFANNLCFGGTMAWSVDFYAGDEMGSSAPVSTDGRCGTGFSGALCAGSGFGKCCSGGGWCGSLSAHCDSGCQNGQCTSGGETTDGTCGAAHGGTTCGLWAQGDCCSSSGYCGDSDGHCGDGCQSGGCLNAPSGGGGSGPVYVDPVMWQDPNTAPTLQCYPPCEYKLPPRTLGTPTTITFDPFTTSLERGLLQTTTWTIDGQETTTSVFETIIITTVITVPPLTTSVIDYWDINMTVPGFSGTFYPRTSILPPPFTIELSASGTLRSTVRTITPRPWPWPTDEPNPPFETKPPTTTDHDTHGVPIYHKPGTPKPKCKSNCKPKCKFFCDWPCLFNCNKINPKLPQFDWYDPEDPDRPNRPVPGAPVDPNDPDDEEEDEDDEPVDRPGQAYIMNFEEWTYGDMSEEREAKAVSKVLAALSAAGDFGGSGVTSAPGVTPAPTNFISCSHRNQNPGQGIYTAYCVCDGSTFAEQLNTAVTPHNSCAFTQKPTSTAAIQTGFAATTDKDKCTVCTRVGPNQQDCTSLSNCTPKPTATPGPSSRCVTGHVYDYTCGDPLKKPPYSLAIQIWDNGVKVCDVNQDVADRKSDSVTTLDCGNSRSVSVTGNRQSMTYKASDGSVTMGMSSAKTGSPNEECPGLSKEDGWFYEESYQNGQCTKCPVADVCGGLSCSDFDGKCE